MSPEQKEQHQGLKDTIDHLFCCKSKEAVRIQVAALEKFERTPCSRDHLDIVGSRALELKQKLLQMVKTSGRVRIGLFDAQQQDQLLATLGEQCSDLVLSKAKLDIIKFISIFAEATVQLVHARNEANPKIRKKQLSASTGPSDIFRPRPQVAEVRSRVSVFQQLTGQMQDEDEDDDKDEDDEDQRPQMTESQVAEMNRVNDAQRQAEAAERRSARAERMTFGSCQRSRSTKRCSPCPLSAE